MDMYYVIVVGSPDVQTMIEWLTQHREIALGSGRAFKVVTIPAYAREVGEWTRISMMPYSAHGKVLEAAVIHCDPNYPTDSHPNHGLRHHYVVDIEECLQTCSRCAMGVLRTVE